MRGLLLIRIRVESCWEDERHQAHVVGACLRHQGFAGGFQTMDMYIIRLPLEHSVHLLLPSDGDLPKVNTGGKRYPPNMSQRVLRDPKFFPNIFSSQAVGDVCPKRIPKYKVMRPLPKACPKEGAIMWMSQAGPNVVSQTLPKTDRFANTYVSNRFPKVCQGVRIVRNRVPCTDTVGCISNVHWSSRNNDDCVRKHNNAFAKC
jgi:hypothetical protein